MSPEVSFWMGMLAVFATVALMTVWAGSVLTQRAAVVKRLAGKQAQQQGLLLGLVRGPAAGRLPASGGIGDSCDRGELRTQLVLAGYFSPNAPAVYRSTRLVLTVVLPLSLLLLFQLQAGAVNPLLKFIGLAVALLLGYVLPDAWIKRRQRLLQESYRAAFPDLLDLLLVAVDAGLSIDAALERIAGEIEAGHRELAANVAIMTAEMRAGRGTVDALHGLAERLGIEEVRTFAVLLQQSIELGSNIGDALRVYSNEMREKRMARAEERAMALPVKIVLPLGAFIFPVILIIILAPVMIRLIKVFNTY